MRRVIIGLFTLVVLAIVFIALCTFVRRPYEIVLLNRFGNVIVCSDGADNQVSPLMYHWYFKLPTDRVVRIDTRLHLEQTPLQQVVTGGSEPISIRTFVAWRIVDPVKFYKTTGSDEAARGIIERKISGLVQAKIASYKLDELFNTDPKKVHMAEMEEAIAKEASTGSQDPARPGELASGVDEQGLQIVQVGFSRMAFPPGNAQAVYDRMAAERDKQASDFESQGNALYKEITQQGLADAAKLRGAAMQQAGHIRGEGDSEANQILASVQQSKSAREFYQYWKSLEFVKGAFTKNTYIVLPTDSDWLHPLFNAPQNLQGFPSTQPAKTSAAAPPLPTVDQLAKPILPMEK